MQYRRILRASQVVLIAILAIVALGADDASARFDRDSHKLMCVCGCNQLLGECNHVGCPDSDRMRNQLMASIAKGESDDAIFHEFQQQYGPVALAAPMFTPFNHVAWIMPPLVLFLGIGVTMLLARRWKLHASEAPARHAGTLPNDEAIRNRIRRETEL
jgi:cytochrome c-type biogenesis protein CcmH/NrfF